MREYIMDAVPAGESSERENFANRKLIRPTLARGENHNHSSHAAAPMQLQERRERPERHERAGAHGPCVEIAANVR
jgi:hypothetical protein